MIKNVVLDIGNVLTDFDWKGHYEKCGMDPETLERVANATVRTADWNEIDRGVMTDEEVLNLFIENDPEMEVWIRKMFADISTMLYQKEYAKGWIIDLQRRGYKVYCLSNMSDKAVRECYDALNFLEIVNGFILSCNVKLIKPDDAIYKKLFETYDLKPEECVFIDDLQRNIDAAEALGMKGILFTDLKTAVTKLSELDTIEKHPEIKTYSKPQRVAALAVVILLVLMYVLTLVFSLINGSFAKTGFFISLGATIIVPIFAWAGLWIMGLLKKKHTIASFDLFENMK